MLIDILLGFLTSGGLQLGWHNNNNDNNSNSEYKFGLVRATLKKGV